VNKRGGPCRPAASVVVAATTTWVLHVEPEQYSHVPLSRYPPAVASARPVGAAREGAIRSPAANSASWPASGKYDAAWKAWAAPRT